MVHMTMYERLKIIFRVSSAKGDQQEYSAAVGLRNCAGIGAAAVVAQAAAVFVSHPLYVSFYRFFLCNQSDS